jgi:hypothetical protein
MKVLDVADAAGERVADLGVERIEPQFAIEYRGGAALLRRLLAVEGQPGRPATGVVQLVVHGDGEARRVLGRGVEVALHPGAG